MKMFKFLTLTVAVAGLLVACLTETKEAVFVDSNAWKGEVPKDAEMIPADEFRKRVESGELKISSPATIAAQQAAAQKQFDDDKAFLEALPQKSAELQTLLAEAAKLTKPDDERSVVGPNGEAVVVFGLSTQLRNEVEIYKRSQDANNALEDYTLNYSLLTDAQKANLPTPESLKGKTLGDVQAALVQLNQVLGTSAIQYAHLEANGPIAPGANQTRLQTQAVVAGNGRDNDGPCTSANLAAKYWFPLKNFISPIKQQGKRGTCWAFAAIGAIESRERVQNNNLADVSEQFLVNKVKEDWDSDKYSDGYWSEKALNLAVDKGQVFPSEAAWTYNQARNRPNVQDNEDSYNNTCDNYTGTCSNTSHESRRTCSTFVFTVCSYVTVTYGGSGVGASRPIQLWANGQGFDLNRYRWLLSQGYAIIASFPVYRGFMDDVNNTGVVSNYAQTKFDKGKEVAGSYGGHAVQIVGFLSNDELSSFNNPVNIGGGGYFIIKNSWGCAADGGFYYVPADYVSKYFISLSILNFDGRRSDAWNKEQAAPGGSEPIKIEIKSNLQADLRVEKELAGAFNITHPVAKSVNLKVTSNLDGTIYDGAWSTDPGLLFGPSLKKIFASLGSRTINLQASYGSSNVNASFTVNVVNTAPKITLQYSGNPSQGEEYSITASVLDINESSSTVVCANMFWTVTTPDTLNTATGCQVKVKFGTTGTRQLSVITQDSEGATAAVETSFDVQPPPVNPYPRIKSAGVYSHEFVTGGAGLKFCGNPSVVDGNTIDLRQKGCSLFRELPAPWRFYGGAEIENPSNETLTYQWDLYATSSVNNQEYLVYSGYETAFPLSEWGNESLVTNNCRVFLTVVAPEASRSKSQTVWTGKCTYYSYSLR